MTTTARAMRLAVSIALLGLTAACAEGGSGAEQAAPVPQETAAPSTADGGGTGDGEVLTGVVGEPDNPDAFTITLSDASGEPVDTVPAGEYEVRVRDLSEIHNFHLTGEGVDESTTVAETGEMVWEVTLEPGDYTYICDPHPSMVGEFTVT
jgi:hypothetical protein